MSIVVTYFTVKFSNLCILFKYLEEEFLELIYNEPIIQNRYYWEQWIKM